ncbi:hypothetical protein AB0O91_14875 [Kitasatospora sp. NPDC089797]|uniref:hypothetical protein n=1 Tax=Kitasatospora sp. NPDC089797 TaxID=3155298 RepID=UPI0034438C0B
MTHTAHLPAGPDRPEALLLTGTVGVGKTTTADLVGDLLADLGVPSAVIDLDRLCQAWPAPAGDPFQRLLLLANLRAVAGNYRAAGAHRLVLAGVAESAAERDAYQEALGMPLRVCRLTADLPAVHARLRARHEADHDTASLPWHLHRADELHTVLESAGISDLTVDTTHLAPDQVAHAVLTAAHWPGTAPDHPA